MTCKLQDEGLVKIPAVFSLCRKYDDHLYYRVYYLLPEVCKSETRIDSHYVCNGTLLL